jgi:uncharacterized protein YifN (PemK superfamily)
MNTGLTIKYVDRATNETLGIVSKTGITEALIPRFTNDHSCYLNRRFDHHPDTPYWLINDSKVEGGTAVLTISAVKVAPISYASYAKSQSQKVATHFIDLNYIVDVDFGLRSSILDVSGIANDKNQEYLSTLLHNEWHKRRPCVVIGVNRDSIQVVPLSTRDTYRRADNAITMSKASFSGFAFRYTESPSRAVIDEIQTVSPYRIFPVLLKDGKHAQFKARPKACQTDIEGIRKALADRYNTTLVQNITALESRVNTLNIERAANRDRIAGLRETEENTAALLLEYEAFITRVGEQLGANGSVAKIIEALNLEL